MTRISTK